MSTKPIDDTLPAWTKFRVPVFRGLFDTNTKTGADYETQPLASLMAMKPWSRVKGEGPAFVPSTYPDYDAREHKAQRDNGQFVCLTGDIDSGNHELDAVRDAVLAFIGDVAWCIYSSPHSRPGDKRWRILVPLDAPQPFDTWHDAQTALFDYMEAQGFTMDRALARAAQPVFLPNVPPVHPKSGTALRGDDRQPLYFERENNTAAEGIKLDDGEIAKGIALIRHRRLEDEKARERIRKEAEQRRAAKPRGDNASLIEDFNASNSVATMLELCGYEQSPRGAEDWRSPHQTGETYATRIIGSKWVSLSASDTAAGVGEKCSAGCFGDAYDLYVHYKHGGDHKAAFRALGQERRDANVIPFPTPEPPSWMDELPTYDEMPEWAAMEPDDDPAVMIEQDPSETPTLPFFWFDEAEPNLEANDFVEGLLTTTAMSVIYGPSNCGKTFFVVDLALHVAWGREWRGRAVDRGAVVYLSLEGSQGIRNRLAAFRKHHGIDESLPFVAMPQPVNLLDSAADVDAVIALVLHVAHVTNMPVSMVIIDTLSRAMAGGNENSPEDMTALIGNCDRIRHATGSHVCIVHHSGKDDAKGARGHSSLRAATDTEIEIKRDPELTISAVRIAKQRDLEAADPFQFSLKSIPLGTNRRGKDVTSCVVVEPDETVILARSANQLSMKEEQALNALKTCLIAGGFESETSRNGGDVSAVTFAAWKRALMASEIIDRDNHDSARSQFSRIRKALENKGYIETEGSIVWLARHCET